MKMLSNHKLRLAKSNLLSNGSVVITARVFVVALLGSGTKKEIVLALKNAKINSKALTEELLE